MNIFNTDLGYQYTSKDLKELCKEFNITQSISKKGYPYDNGVFETISENIKKAHIQLTKSQTFL